jgi:hypothetical protein
MTTPYVGADSLETLRLIEEGILSLNTGLGILFISVEADPALDGNSTTIHIRVGVEHTAAKDPVYALVSHVLRKVPGLKGCTVLTSVMPGVGVK